MLPQFMIAIIEILINQAFKLSPDLVYDLSKVKHKTLLLHISNWQQDITVTFTGKEIILLLTQDEAADCCINASIDTLLALKNPEKLTQLIRAEKLDIQGDLKIAQTYSSAFSQLDIDWPEQLSPYIGDAMSYRVCQGLKNTEQKSTSVLHNVKLAAKNKLDHGGALTVYREELKNFTIKNKQLTADVDQLARKIDKLNSKK